MNKYKRLTLEERKLIEKLIKQDFSASMIAEQIGRRKNAVVVEIRRCGGRDKYNADVAQADSDKRCERRDTSWMSRRESIVDEHKDEVKRLFESGKTFWQIKRETGINHQTLIKIFEKLNIKQIHTNTLLDQMNSRIEAIEAALEIILKSIDLK